MKYWFLLQISSQTATDLKEIKILLLIHTCKKISNEISFLNFMCTVFLLFVYYDILDG